MMHDGHCFAVVEDDMAQTGLAMAGKVEEGMCVEEESQESQELVEEEHIGLMFVSEAR